MQPPKTVFSYRPTCTRDGRYWRTIARPCSSGDHYFASPLEQAPATRHSFAIRQHGRKLRP
jgi:hypothetical protein